MHPLRVTGPAARRRIAGLLAVTVLGAALAGCSGSGSTGAAAAPTGPTGPCDKAAFAQHAGLAAGAVSGLVWKPFTHGEFAAKAKTRAAALKAGSRAGALASRELTAASAQVTGCPASTRLNNALTTGISLSRSVSHQLGTGAVNTEALGGVNSIVSVVLTEGRAIGLPAKAVVPTPAQLAAG